LPSWPPSRRAARQWQWQKAQANAGIAAFNWRKKNTDASLVVLPGEIRDWLAPDQWSALEALEIGGYLKTDGDLLNGSTSCRLAKLERAPQERGILEAPCELSRI
jgi:hypothetical protein